MAGEAQNPTPEAMQLAQRSLLEPAGLDAGRLGQALDLMLGAKVDAADLYFQVSQEESWSLEDGIVKEGSSSIEQGVGVRALAGERTGFAYSDEIQPQALEEAARAARAIAGRGGQGSVQAWHRIEGRHLYQPVDPTVSLTDEQKVAWLERVDREARKIDPRIVRVMASVHAVHELVLIANNEGALAADVRPLVRMNVSVIVEQNGRREQGYCGAGGRYTLAELVSNERPIELAREAARQALVNLEAVNAPAGAMSVVLGPGWPGILLHEAIGHGLEADFNRKKTSAFAGLIGQKVASELCTVVDDGTIPFRRGSLNVDDEGNPTHQTVLIEKGILQGYLQDRLSADLMKSPLTGNGRRQSYDHIPMPRMTNTFMMSGDSAPEDIIKSVKRGLYAVQFGGGQVDITSGKFVFSASEAYLIEDGHITAPVKGATLIGDGPTVLRQVTAVGSDLQLDHGIGVCGKDGQTVPVSVGLPTIKIKEITVGGTEK